METWFTLDSIEPSSSTDRLFCISVDNEEKQFLAGKIKVPTHNSEQGRADDELKGEAAILIGSIARLGRAAGVHLVIATQRPDASIIAGETRANLSVRINCGRTKSTASSMILENSEGTRVKSNPRGRLYVQVDGNGDHGQGFFANQDWIDNYLASQGFAPDGTPLEQAKKSKLANIVDMNTFEGTDLDSASGIDNDSVIEAIRAQEEAGIYNENEDHDDAMFDDDDGDWDIEDDDEDDAPSTSSSGATTVQANEEVLKQKHETDGFGGLNLKGSTGDKDKFARPEDDWDDELDALISENFDE